MSRVRINPGKVHGSIKIPPSKSHTIRALFFALMAKGKSQIHNYLPSPDTSAMCNAMGLLGARVDVAPDTITVQGVNGKLEAAEDVIQCGNSGQVLRFIGALAALSPSYTILTGDASIRQNRPIVPLLGALKQLGAFAVSSRMNGEAPIIVRGPIAGGKASLNGEDSQPVSGLLMLGAFAPLELNVTNPGEKPWVRLTLSWLDRFGIAYTNRDFTYYRTQGGAQIPGFEYTVPGDFSSAAFPIAAALITQSELTLENIDRNDVQGDKAIIPVLESMGARFDFGPNTLTVKKSSSLRGKKIDINDFIDALPILAVIACFAETKTEIVNGSIARKKESDRIHCIALELKKMGALIEEKPDGLVVHPSQLLAADNLETHHDHRLIMALSTAALGAQGTSIVHGLDAVTKSYPTFFRDLHLCGAPFEVHS